MSRFKEVGKAVQTAGRVALMMVVGGPPSLRVRQEIADLDLVDSPRVRALMAAPFFGVRLDPIPDGLKEGGAIVVSNYPGVGKMAPPLVCLARQLAGLGKNRLGVVARAEVMKNPLVAGVVEDVVVPLAKGEDGLYHLDPQSTRKLTAHLRARHWLWLSPTGSTRENGLDPGMVREGVGNLAQRYQFPIVPAGLVLGRSGWVNEMKFGEPIYPKPASQIVADRNGDYLLAITLRAMTSVALLLPVDQRGGLESTDEELGELGDYLDRLIEEELLKKE